MSDVMSGTRNPTASIPIESVMRTLAAAALLVCLGGVLATFGKALGFTSPTYLLEAFHLDLETTLPTWFTSMLLLLGAVLLAAVASSEHTGPFGAHWKFLAICFLFLSIDEKISFHEYVSIRLHEVLKTGGVFWFAWVVAAIPVVICMTIAYSKLVFSLPRRVRNLSILAGACYVTGALGMEMAAGLWVDGRGMEGLVYAALICIEEVLEITGALLWVFALLQYLGPGFTVRLEPAYLGVPSADIRLSEARGHGERAQDTADLIHC
ncbi:MAG TPA: hypothetical protein VEQ63_15605 [Bryobacteraceae bacterium]|nr:hypothetical protein [Bryobacteraceae bacterium]